MTFAEQLRAEKDRLALTLAGLSTALDVAPRTLEHWLSGDRVPLMVAQEGALRRLRATKNRPK